jgi:hypothetical protein
MPDCRQPWKVGTDKNSFETTASHLLSYDPVARKRIATHKRDNLLISGVEGEV